MSLIRMTTMNSFISEIEIMPVRPHGGLVAFASFVLCGTIYCSSVGIMTRLDGSYRLTFPTKKVGLNSFGIFYPIDRYVGQEIEEAVISKYEDVMRASDDRYCDSPSELPQFQD